MVQASPVQFSRTVEVAVAAPIDKTLSYRIPEGMPLPAVGCRVRVPLGRRQAVGFVMEQRAADGPDLKEIAELIDPRPLFHAVHAAFYRRAAEYYAHPLGDVVRCALPAGLSGRGRSPTILHDRLYRPTASTDAPRGERQQALLDFIRAAGEATLSDLRQEFPAPHGVLKRLTELGLLTVTRIERRRDPFMGQVAVESEGPTLSTAQQQAMDVCLPAIAALPQFFPVLLHGVTGSGKTEVYLRAIAAALERGFQALVLVPEIALTPQLVARFRRRFAADCATLAVLHSGLSDGERYDAWRAVAAGEVDVVIGARSAVFAPLPKLGLIVVDEEHDGSYKQSEAFRYNARDLALLRGQREAAAVLLGSATPALTSYQRAREGRFTYLQLPERSAGREMPPVKLVDLTATRSEQSLSLELQEALGQTLADGDQALLLLNRRGYAPFLLCRDCGDTPRCPNCAITLTYSQQSRHLRCHYCDYRLRPPETCPRCQGRDLEPTGFGTERLEEDLGRLFPAARVARMDRDTMTRKGAHHRLVERMTARDFDVLIGTQMIAKGHDFPHVTLVGVLNADTPLNLPDFRSAERVFALLSQVAGRAGRGSRPGRVLIETHAPDHYALECVVRHDYEGFADLELAQRQALGYPPFGHLVNLVLSGNRQERVQAAAEQLAEVLQRQAGSVELLGPAPCLLGMLRGKHRIQLLLKAAERPPLRRLVEGLRGQGGAVPAGVKLQIDVDPLDMF